MNLSTEQNVVGNLPLSCGLTRQQAEHIYDQGKEAVVFALLQLAKMAAEQSPTNLAKAIADDPSTPSSQKPVFAKPNEDRKRRKEPGRKKGHIGSRRQLPQGIDRTVEHIAECCPDCGGELNRRSVKRKRIIEDIPETASVETVEHIIHRDFCPRCNKIVEPVISEALPKSSIGNAILVLSAWLGLNPVETVKKALRIILKPANYPNSPSSLLHLAKVLRFFYLSRLDMEKIYTARKISKILPALLYRSRLL